MPVVYNRYDIIFMQGDYNFIAAPGQSLIYTIIQHLIDKMVKPLGTCGANIHPWALAYRLQPLQDLDLVSTV